MQLTLRVARLLTVCTVIRDFFMVTPAIRNNIGIRNSFNYPTMGNLQDASLLMFQSVPFFCIQESFRKGVVLYLQSSNL